ncbi:MAG: beta-CASP ribonuclease aCPSF1 [Candidatus Bilamarchaeaceae archaeon]
MYFKDIEKTVMELMPKDCGVTRVEPEGLSTTIYIKDINAFYRHDQLIRQIASTIKKKVVVRVDKAHLGNLEDTKKRIMEVVPKEAEIRNIYFNPEFSEVFIESMKPGLVIGKGGSVLKEIMTSTGWAPIALRAPTMPSSTIDGTRKNMIASADERKKFLVNLGKKICQPSQGSDWVRVVALGGFREVGRSCALLQTPHSKVLIDCGVNTATMEPTRAYPYLNMLGFPLEQIDAVVVTHAHMDHMGFVPYLYEYGYDGPVYCTPPTRDIMILLQQDYVNLANRALDAKSPYDKKAIKKELLNTITLGYGEVVDITPEIKMTFSNAGHILGSAMPHFHIGEGMHNLVFTGDMKYGFSRLLDPANTNFPRVETLFIESTYGGKPDIMTNRREMEDKFMAIVKETVSKGGKVLIPVFAVGRSQEVLLVLEDYYRRNPDFNVPIYIDGMVLEASAIHTAYPEYLRDVIQRRILSNMSPFECPLIRVAKGTDKETIAQGEAAIILAPSGMLNGGPSYEYLKLLSDNPNNTLMFVGYQSALSLGSKVQRGMSEVPVLGDDGKTKVLRINMRVESVEGFSGHSDRAQLMAFMKNIRPSPDRVFTLHGDWNKTDDLARSAAAMLKRDARAMQNLESVRLR